MPPKSPKSQIVAFKVEEKLAEFLNRLPNRSAFIRRPGPAWPELLVPVRASIG